MTADLSVAFIWSAGAQLPLGNLRQAVAFHDVHGSYAVRRLNYKRTRTRT